MHLLTYIQAATMYLVVLALTPSNSRTQYIPKRKRRTAVWLQVRWKKVVDCWFEAVAHPIYSMKTTRKKKKITRGCCQPRPGIQRCRRLPQGPVLTSLATVASDQTVSHSTNTQRHSAADPYDSDSYLILIDNCCSACVTNNIKDFDCKPAKVNASVKGVGGAIKLTHKGIVKWSFQDDQGRSHTFRIKDSFYAPNAPCRLLSPQHWSQNASDNSVDKKGTWSATYDDKVELHWADNTYHRTVALDPSTNIAAIQSSPGHLRYRAFHALHTLTMDCPMPVCFNTQTLSDDEESYSDFHIKTLADGAPVEGIRHQHGTGPSFTEVPKAIPTMVDFHDETALVAKGDSEHYLTPTSELLRIHQKLNHLPFKTIQLMAANGYYEKRLVDCRVPQCSACLYGKSARRPWRTKAQPTGASKLCTFSGQCISVNQLESLTPGLIAQLKGIPTTKRYKAATVFIDHYSCLLYIHLQSTLSSEDTLQAKEAFERYCESNGVKVIHYHADNGRFVDNLFLEDIKLQNQRITYCGVNAHIQNGVAEKRIRDLQDLTCTAMLHASARWPKAFSTHLWPYAL